jgi:hypothetical protein
MRNSYLYSFIALALGLPVATSAAGSDKAPVAAALASSVKTASPAPEHKPAASAH